MKTILELQGLSKKIKGRNIINNISFKVGEGQIFGFLGPNGAGKTMTLRMIVGLIKPSHGDVLIDGHSIKKNYSKAMSAVGCIIENPAAYPFLSGYQNLLNLAQMNGLYGEADLMDVVRRVGMEKRIHDKVGTYSLGMKQRLAIAMALLKKPKLLILDEPTNGLDPSGIHEFRNLMVQLAKEEKMTIFVSSHLLSEIQMICDEVAIIMKGSVLKSGKVSELLGVQKLNWEVSDADKAARLLRAHYGLNAVVESDTHLHVYADREMLNQYNRHLFENQIEIQSACYLQESLEDLFMNLTGGETIG